jgi:hypothetical protein
MPTNAALIYLSVTMRDLKSAMSDVADDAGTNLFSGTLSADFTELRSA